MIIAEATSRYFVAEDAITAQDAQDLLETVGASNAGSVQVFKYHGSDGL